MTYQFDDFDTQSQSDENPYLDDWEMMQRMNEVETIDLDELEAAAEVYDQKRAEQELVKVLCKDFDELLEKLHVKTDLKMTEGMKHLRQFQGQRIMVRSHEVPHRYRFLGHTLLHYSDFYFTVRTLDGVFILIPMEWARYVEAIPFAHN